MRKALSIVFVVIFTLYGLSYGAEIRPGSDEYRRANALFASEQYEQALDMYEELLLAPPKGVPVSDLHTRIGDTYFRLGLFINALGEYRTALKKQKEQERPATQYWIAFCCFLLGRNSEALREFLKIPELYPESGMWVSTAYYWAGRVSDRMGKTEEARGYYRKAGGNGRSTQGKFALRKAEESRRRGK